MQITTPSGLRADTTLVGEYGQPSVTLLNVPGIPGKHTYNAAQFLTAKALGHGFTVSSAWISDPDFTLSADDLDAIIAQLIAQANARFGHYEVKWVPADPSTPF